MPELWALPADDYAVRTSVSRGWGCVKLLHCAEMLSPAAIVTLSTVTMAAFAVLAAVHGKRGDRVYCAIIVLEIIVSLLAASGVLTSIGH